MIYEIYYPDSYEAYHEKRHLDRSITLDSKDLEQIPSQDHFTYSVRYMNRPILDHKESSAVLEKEKSVEYQQNDQSITNKSFRDNHSMISNNVKHHESTNIERIPEFVQKAIFRDLKYRNTPKKDDSELLISQLKIYPTGEESSKNEEDSISLFGTNIGSYESPSRHSKVLQELKVRNVKHRPLYIEKLVSKDTITDKINEHDMQTDIIPVTHSITSDSLPMENIFQPRPQLIRYIFFRNPIRRSNEQIKEKTIGSMPCNYGGDNVICKQIDEEHKKKNKDENIKVTSIEISEVPRHKTRHHHGEWFKRDYSFLRH